MIYFIQSADGGPIKIGYARDIDSRVKALEGQSGKEMIVLASLPGGKKDETELHRRFAHLRLDARREQFRPAKDLVDFIGNKKTRLDHRPEKRGRKFQVTQDIWERLQLVAIKSSTDCSTVLCDILDRALPRLKIVTEQ